MENFNVFEFYQFMQENDVILSFKGEISQSILISIGDLLKEKLSYEETDQRVIKKVFFIFVELAQNIYHYSAERSVIEQKQVGVGVLFIRESATHFTIFAGNFVTPEEAKEITEQCAAINRLDSDELKRRYKEQLRQPREEGKIGGGLGFISIVRKAGNSIEAYTMATAENQTFLVLSVRVDKEVGQDDGTSTNCQK